jgi:hypothetical protein
MANNRKQGQRNRKSRSRKMSQRGGGDPLTPAEVPQSAGSPGSAPAAAAAPAVPQTGGEVANGNMQISEQTMNQAKQIAEGLLQNLANGQKGGNAGAQGGGEFAAYESEKGLQGAAISGGSRSQRQRQRAGSKSLRNRSQKQRGGMMPGVMTAFETALVPLGLYLSQKALQSRSGRGKSSSSDRSFRTRFSRRRDRK